MANIRLRLRPQPEKQVSPPRPAHPVGRVRLQLPSAPPWRAHSPFSLCWRHAQASPPAGACRRPVAAMRACAGPRAAGIAAEGRSEDPPRAGGRVATSTPPVLTSVETGGSSHWTAPMDRGKPLYNTSRGLQPAHFSAAGVAAVAAATAAALTAATAAHAAPLAALRTSPLPSPVIPCSAERVVRGPRLPAPLPLHRRRPPASPPRSPRHLFRRRLRRLLLRHRHCRPLHHPPDHSTAATPLPPPRPPPRPSPPARPCMACLDGHARCQSGGAAPPACFLLHLVVCMRCVVSCAWDIRGAVGCWCVCRCKYLYDGVCVLCERVVSRVRTSRTERVQEPSLPLYIINH